MAKIGRPKAEVPRDHTISIRLRDAEYRRIKEYTDRCDTTGRIKAQKGIFTIMENLENGTLKDIENINANETTEFPTMRTIGAQARPSEKKEEKKGAAMTSPLTRDQAFELLKKYNSDPFHIRHALTVEGVMRWFAKELGHADEEEFWGQVGLLHDIDFEQYPEEHCVKAPELLKEGGASDEMIHAICSHGYGICCDVEPTHEMEKVLFAADELTGLIWSYALMREGKSCEGMEVSGLKKKFKDKKFAAGCSRDVIKDGAEKLGWELADLFDKTIKAMQSCEAQVNQFVTGDV